MSLKLPMQPRFVYGNPAVTVDLSIPMRPASPDEGGVGGLEWSASGVPAGYSVRQDSDLVVVLRFHEQEWPAVRSFLRAVQTGASFTWYPDQAALGDSYTCYLVSPVAGEKILPQRSPELLSVYELTITIRSASGAFDLRYFG